MQKKLITLLFLWTAGNCFGQDSVRSINKEKFHYNPGIGFPQNGLTICIGLEYFLLNDLSIGGEIIGNISFVAGISGNANYHFSRLLKLPSKFDLYAGLNVSECAVGLEDKSGGPPETGHHFWGGQIGCKYYLLDDLTALFIELEAANRFVYSNVAVVQIGISIKFKIPKLFPVFPDIKN